MEELLKQFLKDAAGSAVQAGIVSLATDVDFKDAFKTIGGLNLASSVVGGDSPLDFFKNKQVAAGPTGQAAQAPATTTGINTQALLASTMGLDPRQRAQQNLAREGFQSSTGMPGTRDQSSVSDTALSNISQPEADTRGIMAALGDVITGDGGRGNALKQLFMPDPEGNPDPFRRFAPALIAAIAAGKMGGAFDPVEQQQVQAYGGITGQGLLNQNPGGYRIGVPAIARGYAKGGDIDPSTFPRRTGGIAGPGTGTSDDIPAMLSDGEFVMTAKAVEGMGNGSREQGIRNMYQMMNGLEKRMA